MRCCFDATDALDLGKQYCWTPARPLYYVCSIHGRQRAGSPLQMRSLAMLFGHREIEGLFP